MNMGHVMRNTFVWTCLLIAVPLEAVTVSPSLCPTNKIAPHKLITSWDRPSYRTFAAYYDLLTPNAPPQSNPSYPQNQQQEQPQEDQTDDCGDIDDYDENDLSSITQQRRREDRADSRFWFGDLFNMPPQQPQPLPPYQPPNGASKPTARPPRPPRPGYPPARPPYWSGGVFSNNPYRPPQHEVPSDNFKPVHESAHYSDVPQTYRPGAVVGAPAGHIVGVTQVRPTTSPILDEDTRRRQEYLENFRPHSAQASQSQYTRRPSPRKFTNNNSVIGSFIDLLFK